MLLYTSKNWQRMNNNQPSEKLNKVPKTAVLQEISLQK